MKDGKVDESRRFGTSTYVFYKRKGSAVDYDGQVLKNLKGNIGAPRGYSIVDDLRKKGYTVEESNSTLTDLKRLAEGRIDAAAALELTGDKILKKDSQLSGLIEKIGTPISAKAYYFMLSNQFVKSNPQLAEKIWDTVREIREKYSSELIGKQSFYVPFADSRIAYETGQPLSITRSCREKGILPQTDVLLRVAQNKNSIKKPKDYFFRLSANLFFFKIIFTRTAYRAYPI